MLFKTSMGSVIVCLAQFNLSCTYLFLLPPVLLNVSFCPALCMQPWLGMNENSNYGYLGKCTMLIPIP